MSRGHHAAPRSQARRQAARPSAATTSSSAPCPLPSCTFLHISQAALLITPPPSCPLPILQLPPHHQRGPRRPPPRRHPPVFSLPPRGDTDTLNKVCGWGCRCGAPQGREARSAQLRAWLPPGRAAGCSWRLAAAGRLLCCAAVLVPRRPSHLLRRSSWWPCCCLQTCWAATS